jgi:hypothetical protein
MEHILAITMELLHALGLYYIALFAMHVVYLSDSEYIGKIDIMSI